MSGVPRSREGTYRNRPIVHKEIPIISRSCCCGKTAVSSHYRVSLRAGRVDGS